MMKVETYIAQSKLIPEAGLGAFAKNFIPKGTIVWEFTPGLDLELTEEFYLAQDSISREFIEGYAFKYNNKLILCVDNSRFLNHSTTFNNTIDEAKVTVAVRDIQAGEELICNYSKFGVCAADHEFNMADLEGV